MTFPNVFVGLRNEPRALPSELVSYGAVLYWEDGLKAERDEALPSTQRFQGGFSFLYFLRLMNGLGEGLVVFLLFLLFEFLLFLVVLLLLPSSSCRCRSEAFPLFQGVEIL